LTVNTYHHRLPASFLVYCHHRLPSKLFIIVYRHRLPFAILDHQPSLSTVVITCHHQPSFASEDYQSSSLPKIVNRRPLPKTVNVYRRRRSCPSSESELCQPPTTCLPG